MSVPLSMWHRKSVLSDTLPHTASPTYKGYQIILPGDRSQVEGPCIADIEGNTHSIRRWLASEPRKDKIQSVTPIIGDGIDIWTRKKLHTNQSGSSRPLANQVHV